MEGGPIFVCSNKSFLLSKQLDASMFDRYFPASNLFCVLDKRSSKCLIQCTAVLSILASAVPFMVFLVQILQSIFVVLLNLLNLAHVFSCIAECLIHSLLIHMIGRFFCIFVQWTTCMANVVFGFYCTLE